jgi:hypothetical protein
VAGTGSGGNTATQLNHPDCLVIDANNSLYICDHDNNRIQKWFSGATSGITIAGTGAGVSVTLVPHPIYIALDKNGYMYVTSDQLHVVLCFPPNSPNGTIVAGSTQGSALNQLDTPTDMVVDDNLNIFVIDSHNSRVMQWPPNATSGIIMISSLLNNNFVGIQFAPNSTNEVYMSSTGSNAIYLWTFGQSTPNLTVTIVTSPHPTFNNPQCLILDPYNNVYVADRDNTRVVRLCGGSTVGIPVVGEQSSTAVPNHPIDMAFDSNLNMYVVVSDSCEVMMYTRL